MRRDYGDFDDNFTGKQIAVGDTVFVKQIANTLNRILGYNGFSSAYDYIAVYAQVLEIKKNSFRVKFIELVDTNMLCGYCDKALQDKEIIVPKKKCFQWGKDKDDSWARCHWVEA